MMGHRYGSSYLPSSIDKSEFEMLKQNVDEHDYIELSKCYQLDENITTGECSYKLLDAHSIFKNEIDEMVCFKLCNKL